MVAATLNHRVVMEGRYRSPAIPLEILSVQGGPIKKLPAQRPTQRRTRLIAGLVALLIVLIDLGMLWYRATSHHRTVVSPVHATYTWSRFYRVAPGPSRGITERASDYLPYDAQERETLP